VSEGVKRHPSTNGRATATRSLVDEPSNPHLSFGGNVLRCGRFPQAVYAVNTPKGRQQPTDIFKQGADLRERSDQLLRRLKRLLEESALVPFDVSPSRVILLDDATV